MTTENPRSLQDALVAERLGPASSSGYKVKRLLLGRALHNEQLQHERLGKPTALAVFASDNLSSVAYATEEILRALVPVVGAVAFGLVLPISAAIVLVLATLLFSYRQTIKAYPTAGGAYVVTKDNFGLMPAQVAGVALLIDYVLTVAVSVAAGTQALTSAFPGLFGLRVIVSLAFIGIIAWGNLRGVKESGKLFAAPTYFFIVSMFVLLIWGVVKFLTGNLHPITTYPIPKSATLQAASIFLILRAFASGGAAVTGVEAISNGVPAFKPPEWKNARTTLMWMGSLLGTMFITLSFLAHKLSVVPDPEEKVSVVALVSKAVFGNGGAGKILFFAMQAATMIILVLAANTSFADFPRLANFHAADLFLPKQFTKRGHRLVFSNGIISLAVASGALIIAFQASVTRLIPLYALGVFTSFTLSQAGMARRHLRLREPGWKTGLAINGFGAFATFVVDIIIGITKFAGGAWAIMIAVPVLVFLLVRMNHQYEHEVAELAEGIKRFESEPTRQHLVVVIVDALDAKTLRAVQYAKTIAPTELVCLHLDQNGGATSDLAEAWKLLGSEYRLEAVKCENGDRSEALSEWVRAHSAPNQTVTVAIPGPAERSWWDKTLHGRTGAEFSKALHEVPNVNVTVVRHSPNDGSEPLVDVRENRGARILARPMHTAIVLVDRADRSILKALNYAKSTRPIDITCLHIGIDPDWATSLLDEWTRLAIPYPLQLILCEDRNLGRKLAGYVSRMQTEGTQISVILPRRDYTRTWHRLLHDRTSRQIGTALAAYPQVDMTVVPYRISHSKK